jgi:CHASE2 domain-containing sensor protein
VESFTSQSKESNTGHGRSGPDDWLRFSALGVQKFTGKPAKPQREFINYRGAAGTFEALPMEELFSDSTLKSDPRYEAGSRFKDKLVYIGPVSEVFHDEHVTPLGTQSGVEIHAHYGATLIDDNPILEFPERTEFWLLVVLLVASAVLLIALDSVALLAATDFRMLFKIGTWIAVFLGYMAASYVLFATSHIMVPVAPILAALAMGLYVTIFDLVADGF